MPDVNHGVLLAIADIRSLTDIVGVIIYIALALVALWGAFCVVLAWMRIGRQKFSSDDAQDEFLAELERALAQKNLAQVQQMCQDDVRAIPQLALLGIRNRHLGYGKLRQLLYDRFERDVIADLEHRLSWINTVVKGAPMLGLFGTVIGMMGAFGKLAANESVSANVLAEDISLALITTADGLAIAIPLVLCSASIQVRIRKLEAVIESGLGRLLDALRPLTARAEVVEEQSLTVE